MTAIKAAWAWLRKWGLAIAGILLLALGAGWLWRRKQRELGRVRDQLAVEESRREIAALQAQRDAVLARVDEHEPEVAAIDRQLADNRRRIVEAHEHGRGLSDEEVEDAFAKLGY